MSEDWGKVERLPAMVTLADGSVIPGAIHVQGAVSYRDGAETPLEMLNRSEAFFPVTREDGHVLFLAKPQVVMVACEAEENGAKGEGFPVRLRVTLDTGLEFEGEAEARLPEPRRRPLDYVNSSGRFFLLRAGRNHRLVNHAHVRMVRPLDQG